MFLRNLQRYLLKKLILIVYFEWGYLAILGILDWNKVIINYKHFKIKIWFFYERTNIGGVICSAMVDRYAVSDDKKRLFLLML